MQKTLWAFLIALAVIMPLRAELYYEDGYNPDQSQQAYFNEAYPHFEKSIIYVFYNDVYMSCQNCAQTIDLIEQVYKQNYQNQYNLFIINYGENDEYNFISAYELREPFEVVLVRISDGTPMGFKKLENLNYQISDPYSFEQNIKYQIESFLDA